jgi:hypothetical protein
MAEEKRRKREEGGRGRTNGRREGGRRGEEQQDTMAATFGDERTMHAHASSKKREGEYTTIANRTTTNRVKTCYEMPWQLLRATPCVPPLPPESPHTPARAHIHARTHARTHHASTIHARTHAPSSTVTVPPIARARSRPRRAPPSVVAVTILAPVMVPVVTTIPVAQR